MNRDFPYETIRSVFLHMGQYKPAFARYPYDLVIVGLAILFVCALPFLVVRLGRAGMAGKPGRTPAALFFSGFFLLLLSWSLAFPVYQVPDEQAHFAYVQHMAEQGSLPVARVGRHDGTGAAVPAEYDRSLAFHRIIFQPRRKHPFTSGRYGIREEDYSFSPDRRKRLIPLTVFDDGWKISSNHYPPLYYAGGAALYRLFYHGTFFTRFWAVRVFSILLALGVIFLTRKLACRLGRNGDDRGVRPWAAAALVGILPMFCQVGVSVSPNILEMLLQAVFILLALRIGEEGATARRTAALGLVTAAGMLTRQHLAGLFPLAAGAVVLAGATRRAPFGKTAKNISLLTTIVVAAAGWWYVWFYSVHRRTDFAAINFTVALPPRFTLTDYILSGQAFIFPYRGFWGSFAWQNIDLPVPVTAALSLMTLVGTGLFLVRSFARGAAPRRRSAWLLGLLGAYFLFIMIVGYCAFSFRADDCLQGRHFFGLLVGLVAAAVYGYTGSLPERKAEPAAAAALACAGALNLYSLLALVIPRFY